MSLLLVNNIVKSFEVKNATKERDSCQLFSTLSVTNSMEESCQYVPSVSPVTRAGEHKLCRLFLW